MKVDFKKIYIQEKIRENSTWKKNADIIIARFPQAEVQVVNSHWQLPEISKVEPQNWLKMKHDILILGIKSALIHRVNGRSGDYIAASISNGCLSSCQYCYVARRKGTSNPLTIFVNVEQIADSIERHQNKLGLKKIPNQCDPLLWTYDIGCNSDLSIDALVCDHPGYMIERFANMTYAKATFATKSINEEFWLRYNPKGHTRIRYSLMPQRISRSVDIGTSLISKRIQSINTLVEAGYEVHLNFSPIIIYEEEQWKKDWKELWQEIESQLSSKAKSQLACEAFFLSHDAELHEINLQWNPRGEDYLWNPNIQTKKITKTDVIVYNYYLKQKALSWFTNALKKELPYCPIRYSF